ncbi:hypothetical protein NDU88_006268 [Pleurodeles waltl]|uniref:Uncharacterized protein n=1 Tax=Pleurodeles waltl TaxID=8319 RepID=A0AAV7UL13_PLEWA|nr:hypothetical protein NDU88_006268 [Pleurodeles waltl]
MLARVQLQLHELPCLLSSSGSFSNSAIHRQEAGAGGGQIGCTIFIPRSGHLCRDPLRPQSTRQGPRRRQAQSPIDGVRDSRSIKAAARNGERGNRIQRRRPEALD